jgi:hypothetical protein
MKAKFPLFPLAAFLAATLLVCCENPWIMKITEPLVPNVYVAGQYNDGNSRACYWLNGKRTDLDGGNMNTYVTAITVADGDVYIAGYYEYSSPKYIACYWKNGTRIDLDSGPDVNAGAQAITVLRGTVFAAGFYTISSDTYACYWINGTLKALDSGSAPINACANGITVHDGTIYTTGQYETGGSMYYACYWRNEIKTNLSFAPSYAYRANAITAVNGNIYIVGQEWAACYWKNGGSPIHLQGGSGGITNAITVQGNTIYIAGTVSSVACYWVNETIKTLSGTAADAIAVKKGDIYIAGRYASNYACYWVNGKQMELEIPAGATSHATGIAVP